MRPRTSYRNRAWGFAALLTALATAPGGAQLVSDVRAFPLFDTYTASDRVVLVTTGKGCVHQDGMTRDGNTITLRLWSDDIPPISPAPCPSFVLPFPIDFLPAATYQLRVQVDGQVVAQSSFLISPPKPELQLSVGDGIQYFARLEFKVPGASPKAAFGVPLASTAGYFWFFSPTNPEVQIKLIGARALNGHTWLFLASATTLEFDLVVEGCVQSFCDHLKRYHQQADRAMSIFDVEFH
jgi:hypothetical protein